MAPIKFEDNIKTKLEKRSIQPSRDAWSQLSSQLDTEHKKKSTRRFFYIGIAASMIGVLFVTTLFLKSSEGQHIMPSIVNTTGEENTQKLERKQPNVSTSVVTAISSPIESKKKQSKEVEANQQLVVKAEIEVAELSEDHKRAKITLNTPMNVIKAKAIKVSDFKETFEIGKESVSDAEIEELLKQAEKELLKQQLYKKTTQTVDANALLQDVEEDLEQSFRTKVFETLKTSYKTVKTAVAERRN